MRHLANGWFRSFRFGLSAAGVIALLALAVSPAAAAVQTLTITTPYPAVQVDPGGQVELPLTVLTPAPQKVDLSVTNVPAGFKTTFRGGGFIVSSVYTSGNDATPAPGDLKVRVEVPATAAAQDYNMTVHAASGSQTADLPITLKVAASQGTGVKFTTAVQAKTGAIGSPTTFSLTLHNTTAASLKFSVTVPDAPAGWTVTAKPSNQADPNNFSIAGGDTDTITVSADPPSTVAAGVYQFTVVASDGGSNTTQMPLQVSLSGSESLSLVSKSGILNASANAGSPTSYAIIVRNTGSAPLTGVKLTNSPPTNWKVAFSQTSIDSIPPGREVEIPVTITPASDAVAGDYIVTLNAAAGTATGTMDVRTRVETSTIWGYIGIGLIALVVIAVLLVFRRYGRR